MDGSSFLGQVLAGVFRRAPAFQHGLPTTFPGRVRALWREASSRRSAQEQPAAVLPPETVTIHARTYNDARSIGEAYRQGKPVLLDVSQLSDDDARRLVDFSAGLIFGMHGTIERIARFTFLLGPGAEAGTTPTEPLPEDAELPEIVRQLLVHPDPQVRRTVRNVWNISPLPVDAKVALIERYAASLAGGTQPSRRRAAT